MKILFKNTTEYSKENYNQFVKFHQDKFGTKTILKIGVIAICLLYIFMVNLFNKNWRLIGILLIVGLVIYGLNKLRISVQTEDRKKTINNKKKFTFFFYNSYIKVKSGRKFDRIRYFELYKIFKTEDYFFLYTDEDHSLILSKDGFEIGTPEAFDLFIKKKCPLKYRK